VDPLFVGIIGVVVLLLLLIAGVHIAVALLVVGGIGSIIIVGFKEGVALTLSTVFFNVFWIQLAVLPLFILAGLLAAQGELNENAYRAMSMWFGRVRGGLGIATAAGCTLFGTVCGSAIVTAAVFAKVAAPQMRKYGYDKRLTYGIVSSAGNIGMLIPPSTLIVFYAVLTEESPGKLLIAGIAPGLALFLCLSVGMLIIGYLRPQLVGAGPTAPEVTEHVTWLMRFKSLVQLWPFATVFLVLVGGIFTGFFTVTEAAAVTIFVLLILIPVTGHSFKGIAQVLADSAGVTAMLFFLIIAAVLFSRFLILTGIGPAVLDWIVSMQLSAVGLTIAMCILYIFLGCFLEASSMLLLTIPLIYPVVKAMGIEPTWFAMSIMLAIHAGTITPPVGLVVFGVKGVAEADVSLGDIFRGVTPFFLMTLAATAIIIAFPTLSTILPDLMIR